MTWIRRWPQWLILAACLSVAGSGAGAQTADQTSSDEPGTQDVNRTYVGQQIYVASGQHIANATCIFCSVEVDGEVSGRVLVLFGNLTVTGRVGGNAVVVGGNVVLDDQARLGSNAIVIFGNAVYETDNVIAGSAYVLGGHASSFEAHQRMHHRFSFTPSSLAIAAVLVIVLLASALTAAGRQRLPR